MIITLSPAKLMNFKSKIIFDRNSEIQYPKEAKEINDLLKRLSVEDISKLMSINPKQSLDVYHYIHTFDLPNTPKRQAAFAYNGIAYKGFDASTLTNEDWDYAQNHLVILSGLYGIVRPLDIIKPYRLEMHTEVNNPIGKNLYAYWKKKLNKKFSNLLEDNNNTWVNLTSAEYSKVIDRKLLPKGHRIITPTFKEYDKSKDQYKMIVVYAKKARGMMSRFIVKNKLTDAEDIKAFDTEGYFFSPHLSKNDDWVFVR